MLHLAHLVLNLNASPALVAEADCVFSPNAFNVTWIESRPQLRPYTWIARDRAFKIVLSPNESVRVTGGGCADYGETYKLTVTNAGKVRRSSKWYKSKLLSLASKTLNRADFRRFSQQIASLDLSRLKASPRATEPQVRVDSIPDESFGITIHDKGREALFVVSWYVN